MTDAVRAAAGAFPAWSRLGHEIRAKYLLRIADLIDQNLEELALAESRDQGKPVSLARSMDIPRASLNFRKFAYAWQGLVDTAASLENPAVVNISSRDPLGVAGLISPWNLEFDFRAYNSNVEVIKLDDNSEKNTLTEFL